MDTEKVSLLTKQVNVAYANHMSSIKRYEDVKQLCGQSGYSVTIAGANITVAKIQDRSYVAKLVSGAEMIHLGALKMLDAEVDRRAKDVIAAKEALIAEVNS